MTATQTPAALPQKVLDWAEKHNAAQPKDGIYQNVSDAAYAALDAVNVSTLLHFAEGTPAHARARMLKAPEPTPAQQFGTAFHCLVLEPERFRSSYVEAPKCDRRTKAGKDAWAKFEADSGAATPLTALDFAKLTAMRDGVRANADAAALLDCLQYREFVVLWTDRATGLRCKGRIDGMGQRTDAATGHRYTVVLDLKSADAAGAEPFARSIAKYGYHVRAAWYLDGLDAIAPATRHWHFIACEKDPPFLAAPYLLGWDSIEQGRREYRAHLDSYARCVASNEWPGYGGTQEIELPAWARKDWGQE